MADLIVDVSAKNFPARLTEMTSYPKNPTASGPVASPTGKAGYNRFLLLVAGLGGLLYGVDVGIIAGALPYLEATFKDAATGQTLNAGQLSFIVAAVLLGSVISTLFAGMLADWLGRKKMMAASGMLFVISIPMIALAHGYWPLVFGRLLQGISGGLIGVVIPLYLAECLGASNRGKGTGIFQWLLTLGIVAAALIAMLFQLSRGRGERRWTTRRNFLHFKDHAWRSIFWVSLPPGILFVIGSFLVAESPRWLFRRGKKDAALAALLRSRTDEQAQIELKEMEETVAAEKAKVSTGRRKNQGIAAAPQICDSVCAGLRDSGLQSGHRREFHHRLQSDDSDSGRPVRPASALGLRHPDDGEFSVHHCRRDAGGPERAANFCFRSAAPASLFRCSARGCCFTTTEKSRVDVKDAVQAHGHARPEAFAVVRRNECRHLLGNTADAAQTPPRPRTS